MKWTSELPNACCLHGDVKLAAAETPPPHACELYSQRSFLDKIRRYNSAFAFTSTGAMEDRTVSRGSAPYIFRVNGAMHHRICQLLPPAGANPTFAQIYIYDGSTEEEVALRGLAISSGLNHTMLGELQSILHEINPLAAVYQSARDHASASQEMCLVLLDNPRVDPRRYNRPTAEEVAAIMVDGGPTVSHRDVVLRYHRGGLQRIHPLYDPLQYPLIYLRGEVGWSIHTQYVEGVRRNNNSKVSLREHTAYRLYMKHEDVEYSLLHRAGRLMQQWCVDQAAKIIDQRLFFHRRLNTQRLYRRELFSGLRDLMLADHILRRNDPELQDTGTHIILSSSFPGGVRYMRQQYYDSMAIVRQFGKPDLFITVTTNPKWPEIQDSFLPGQTASDRPDIVSRVFKMKLKALLENIVKNRVFGGLQAYVYVIEFQKRGLPHAHILVILSGDSKPRSPADFDRFVCAEIPDHETNPELFETVSTCMIHGPCGAGINSPCVGEDGKCSKRLPKDFDDDTRVDGAGYPVYRRRRSGPIDPALPMGPQRPSSLRTISTTIRNPRQNGPKSRIETVVADNSWVVPYNPYLCQKYNCHVNVEICSTVQSVKYLYKYVYKGQDRATVALRGRRERGGHTAGNTNVNNEEEAVDEIQQYLDARYLPPPEACWAIFKYDMQKKSHHVHRLLVHEEGEQMVHYSTAATLQDVLELNQTAFFELRGLETPEGLVARGLLHHEMPIHFVWKKVGTRNRWMSRKQGGDKAIGRMISVSPRDTNRFYVRLLLCYRRGPISYDDLKTVEGETHATFKGAALALGFLDSDEDNHRCLTEAAHFQMPTQLCHLFAVLLVYCDPPSPDDLWNAHLPALCEDFLRDEIEIHNLQARAENRISEVIMDAASLDTNSRVYRRAIYLTLHDVNSHLVSDGQTLHTYFESLPQFSDYSDVETAADVNDRNRNRLIENETSYESTTLDYQAAALNSLNADQKRVYDKVMEAVHPAG